jgi:DNA-3-methyladenine glycosylase II
MPLNESTLTAARRHLRKADPVMRGMIDEVGPCTLTPHRDRFGMLVRSIISQQISTSAARSIRQRLINLVAPDPITPESLLSFRIEQLRCVGLSPQKAAYMHDLALKASDGTVNLRTIGRRTDEDVIQQLTQIKGIGRWTAQMFLIFSLGRLDVFPHDDLGVRVAIRDRYRLGDLPDKQTSCEIAAPWSPYATIASWYCWRSLELKSAASPRK